MSAPNNNGDNNGGEGGGNNGAEIVALTGGKCPLCGKPSRQETRPFCSRRCANRDLGNWFNESYYVPGHETVDPEDEVANGDDEEV